MAFLILDPTAAPATPAAVPIAHRTRLQTLRGARVGLLANGKTNAGALLDAVGDLLEREHGVHIVRRENKGNASRPAPPAVLDRFTGEVDLILTAVGD